MQTENKKKKVYILLCLIWTLISYLYSIGRTVWLRRNWDKKKRKKGAKEDKKKSKLKMADMSKPSCTTTQTHRFSLTLTNKENAHMKTEKVYYCQGDHCAAPAKAQTWRRGLLLGCALSPVPCVVWCKAQQCFECMHSTSTRNQDPYVCLGTSFNAPLSSRKVA